MKLSPEALLEIVDIFRDGLLRGVDVSERLRTLDLVQKDEMLALSDQYVESRKA